MTGARRAAAAIACAAGSAALLASQRVLLETAARLQSPVDLFFDPKRPVTADVVRSLPYHVVDAVFAPPTWVHAALLVTGLVQTLVLYALYRALRDRDVTLAERIVLGAISVAMLVVALDTRTVNGFDTYAEAGYAKLGLAQAYSPPATPFGNGFAFVSTIWGTPMLPDGQGPGWVALTAATAGRAATLGGAIFTLRVLEVVALLALIVMLARRNTTALAVPALVALNPALYFTYVVNAQPDLFAVTLMIGALAAAASFPILAAVLIACAALVKLPLLLLAPAVFVAPRPPATPTARNSVRARLGYIALAALITAVASFMLGGSEYFARFGAEVRAAFVPADAAGLIPTAIRCGLLVVAAFALVRAFRLATVRNADRWSFIALSPTIAPAALAWMLPYAGLARVMLVNSLIVFPLAAAVLDVSFPHAGFGVLATAAMLAYAVIEAVRLRKTRRPATAEEH